MENKRPDRDQAFALLKEYNRNESLIKHAIAVESVMRHFARLFNEDEEKWGIIGLIHDLDYEMYPDAHCHKTKEILEQEGWPESYVKAVISHGWKICTDVEPVEKMEKVLYTIDELTGLVFATALMRPGKSIMDLTEKSVMKKWKQKSFAAGVNRDIISEGAAMLGMDLEEVIRETINGMKTCAAELGLAGEPSGTEPAN
jgi:predicted hydrolase (HD superfamily)